MSVITDFKTKLMTSFERIYLEDNERYFGLRHGWEVELRCPGCGEVARPVFKGIDVLAQCKPDLTNLSFRNPATIFAKVHCPKCDTDLKEVAGEKLGEIFEDVALPANNRKAIWGIALLWIPLAAFVFSNFNNQVFWKMDFGDLKWWSDNWLNLLALATVGASAFGLLFYIDSLRRRCECGNPSYKFMGELGRSYGFLGRNMCYRCSSCGKLLRLRG